MKKAILVLASAVALTVAMPSIQLQDMQGTAAIAMAKSTAPSLDDIGGGSDSSGDLNLELDGSQDSLSKALDEASDMGDITPQAQKVGSALTKVCTIIVQIISYVIVLGLIITTALDILYISVPPLQGALSGGAMGVAPQQGMQGQQGGMGMSGGIGGMSGMGMNGGMGMSGMGMNGGMGMSGMGMNGMNGGMQAQQAQQGMQGMQGPGKCYVSKSALNAVAMDGQPGPTGKVGKAITIYAKDMAVKLAGTGILVVLAISGALTQLGIVAGSALANAIGSVQGMF